MAVEIVNIYGEDESAMGTIISYGDNKKDMNKPEQPSAADTPLPELIIVPVTEVEQKPEKNPPMDPSALPQVLEDIRKRKDGVNIPDNN